MKLGLFISHLQGLNVVGKKSLPPPIWGKPKKPSSAPKLAASYVTTEGRWVGSLHCTEWKREWLPLSPSGQPTSDWPILSHWDVIGLLIPFSFRKDWGGGGTRINAALSFCLAYSQCSLLDFLPKSGLCVFHHLKALLNCSNFVCACLGILIKSKGVINFIF